MLTLLFSSAKNWLAALALSWILMEGGRVEVNLGDREEEYQFCQNCSEKAASSG